LLESAGARVTIANNGREAVQFLSDGQEAPIFDLVLMDLQMPQMDGYQATAKLRSDARFSALPIIAMTAHATLEERERCFASGMIDHISKPIDPAMLFDTVGRYYRPAPARLKTQTTSNKLPRETVDDIPTITNLDANDGLSRVGGNRKLYRKILRQFVEEQGATAGQISNALAQGDFSLAERLAHTLKGVGGNIGAKDVHSAAGKLEKLIRSRASAEKMESARQLLNDSLEPLVMQLRVALNANIPETEAELSTTSTADPAQSREAAAHLKQLLTECDPEATDFVAANRATLLPLFGSGAWPQFEKLVHDYSFADAQAKLDEAQRSFSA
jgi:FOG: CheY-like receiver